MRVCVRVSTNRGNAQETLLPLAAFVSHIFVLVVDEVYILFVDGVVRQMAKHVPLAESFGKGSINSSTALWYLSVTHTDVRCKGRQKKKKKDPTMLDLSGGE